MSIRFGISQGHLCHPGAAGWPCISQGRSSVRRHLAGADAWRCRAENGCRGVFTGGPWFLKVTFFVTTKKMIELNKIETSKKIQTNLVWCALDVCLWLSRHIGNVIIPIDSYLSEGLKLQTTILCISLHRMFFGCGTLAIEWIQKNNIKTKGPNLLFWLMVWCGLEHLDYCSIYWECHHPSWRTPSFFRGVRIPPTSHY